MYRCRAITESMTDVRVDSLRLFLTHAVGCPRMRMKHWAGGRNGFHAFSYRALAVTMEKREYRLFPYVQSKEKHNKQRVYASSVSPTLHWSVLPFIFFPSF